MASLIWITCVEENVAAKKKKGIHYWENYLTTWPLVGEVEDMDQDGWDAQGMRF